LSQAAQLALWGIDQSVETPVVNVAQIPQRSPFRYPGGKTWLIPQVRKWLSSLPCRPRLFIEPFVGGGIVSLTVAFENLADKVLVVELDKDVAAVWKTMLSDDNDWLANRIVSFNLTIASVKEELSKTPEDTKHHAFQTLVRNRTLHGGILAPGSGLLKYGENGRGIRSRWYPETLRKRIQNIKFVRNKISFVPGDGIEIIRKYAKRKSAAYFIDPPYTARGNGKRAGTRLYTHCELDHDRLFEETSQVQGDFLMTYDTAQEVVEMAKRHSFQVDKVAMMNTHHSTMQELLISRDLSWLET
jgi:DNA adenine methylase